MNNNLVLNNGRSHQENTIEMIKLPLRIRLRTGVSVFSRSVVRNVRDTKMIMHVTDGARRGKGGKTAMSVFSSGAAAPRFCRLVASPLEARTRFTHLT